MQCLSATLVFFLYFFVHSNTSIFWDFFCYFLLLISINIHNEFSFPDKSYRYRCFFIIIDGYSHPLSSTKNLLNGYFTSGIKKNSHRHSIAELSSLIFELWIPRKSYFSPFFSFSVHDIGFNENCFKKTKANWNARC